MAKRDYYEILGADQGATQEGLKKSFRRLAMKYHPDRNPDDAKAEQKFKEAKEAYDVLSDARKRAAYDQFGHAGVDATAGAGGAGFGPGGGFSDIFGDVFGDIFGGSRRSQTSVYRGADLRYDLQLEFEQAVLGDSTNITFSAQAACEACDGSGSKPGTSPKECGTCHGGGQVRMQQGFFSVQQTCPACRGAGTVIADPCNTCRGKGRVEQSKTLAIKVPAGVDNGDRIRLSGEGEAGQNGGPSGDLYVEIRVNSHPIFERDGADLRCEAPINFSVAALGGEVQVPTLEGEVSLKVPAGTQSGKVFRLRGRGIHPVRGGAQGDLYCRVGVETPVKLTAGQKDLLHSFTDAIESGGERHRPRSHSWRKGVRTFFDKIGP